jgi:signal transduction histidine kinase
MGGSARTRTHARAAVFWVLLAACLFPAPAHAARHACHHILLVSSYSTRLQWSADICESVRENIYADDCCAEITTEYMDTKRYTSDEHYQSLTRMFERKYTGVHFDLIITADDNAARFVLGLRKRLFPGVPMVFCGVNDLDMGKKFDLSNTTGVYEEVDLAMTVAVIMTQNPDVETIYVVNDRTTTGLANKDQLDAVMMEFKNRVRFRMLQDLSMEEMLHALSDLPQKSAVLLLSFVQDRLGESFTFRQSIGLFRSVCKRPMYGVWDFYLGKGIVGGMITSASVQGQKAAEMALRILGGESASSIPMLRKSPNQYMFDYNELQHFGIADHFVPQSSVIINEPQSFWRTHFRLVMWGSIIIVVLLSLIMFLSIAVMARRKAESELERINASLEELVAERTDELHHRSMELEGANAKLQKLDELKTSLMNTVSHDLRTPLTSILGFALLIRKELSKFCTGTCADACELPGMRRVFSNMDIIIKEAERLSRLINDFLDMSRLDAGRMPWQDREIDPVKLAADAIEAYSGAFSENADVELIAEISETLPPIVADYDRLRQVLANLLANAKRFTNKGTVTLRVREQDGYVLFAVADTGTGIPDDELELVFDKFHQATDNTLRDNLTGKGSGMGLAISRSIVKHYGGRIWADHNPGGGAVIMFTIPARRA